MVELHSFAVRMKRLLEYLLLFIVAAVLWGSADTAVSAPSVQDMEEIVFNGSITQTSVYYMDVVSELEKMGDFIINISQNLEKVFVKK